MAPVSRSPTSSPVPTVNPVGPSISPNVPPFTIQPYVRESTASSVEPETSRLRYTIKQEVMNLLSKMSILVKLNNSNYGTWANAVTVALEAVEFKQYLLDNTIIPQNQSVLHHEATRRLLCSWLISHIDNQNSSCLNSSLQTLTTGTTYTSPTEIWNALKEFHQKNASHNIFDLQNQLRAVKQGSNARICKQLDTFENIKSQIIQSGENVDNKTLVFVLHESIHQK